MRFLRCGSDDDRSYVDVGRYDELARLAGRPDVPAHAVEPEHPRLPAITVLPREIPAAVPRHDTPRLDVALGARRRTGAFVLEGHDLAVAHRLPERLEHRLRRGHVRLDPG